MFKKKKYLIILTVFLYILSINLTALGKENTPPKFSKIIAFGDSYSDTGEAYRISKDILKLSNPPEGSYLKPGLYIGGIGIPTVK